MNNQKKEDLKNSGYVPSAYNANQYVNKSTGKTVTENGSWMSFNNVTKSHLPSNDLFKKKI